MDPRAIERDLLERYPLRPVRIDLPDRVLSLLAVSGAEELLEGEADRIDHAVWAELWPVGTGLAGYLLRGPAPAGPVLELGAGVGLVGIAAAIHGAEVVQTDLIPDALRTARVNAFRCGVAHRMRSVAADWRAWPIRHAFRLVVGSDITYDSALYPALLSVLRRSVHPSGTLLLADPGRPSGAQFARRLLSEGWRVTEYPLPLEAGYRTLGRLLRAQPP